MQKTLFTFFIIISCTVAVTKPALSLTAIKPIEGLVCMDLKLGYEERKIEENLPNEYARPNESSQIIGKAPSIVFVDSTIPETNGFLKVVRFDHTEGWIQADLLKKHGNTLQVRNSCVPSLMSNGLIGVGTGK